MFALATAGAVGSAVAAILLTSDATVNRVYFGTDTRVQALLVGAAAAALLVRDWSVLTAGGTLIRTRWGAWAAAASFVRRPGGVAVLAHYATGSAREFRAGLLIVVAVAAVLVVAPVALDQGWARRAPAGVAAAGVAGRDLLRRLPVALADLPGAQRGTHRLDRLAAVRGAVRGDGRGGRGVVVAAGAAHPPLAAGDRPDAAAGGCDGGDGGGGDDARVARRRQARRRALGPDMDSAALVSPEVPVEVKSPSGQLAPGTKRVAVFGDSVAWTLMRYLPPTPGLSFTNYTTIGCGIARGGPYGTPARRSTRSPNATPGRAGGRSGSTMTGPTSCC